MHACTHVGVRTPGDSQQTLAHTHKYEKFLFACWVLPVVLLWIGQHSTPSVDSLLALGVRLLQGVPDGRLTLAPLFTVHTLMQYDLISVSAALAASALSPHCLRLCSTNFLSLSFTATYFLTFAIHSSFALVSLPSPRIFYSALKTRKAAHSEERLLSSLCLCCVRG